LLQQGSLDLLDHNPCGHRNHDYVVLAVVKESLYDPNEASSPMLSTMMQCSWAFLVRIKGSGVPLVPLILPGKDEGQDAAESFSDFVTSPVRP
jgi:hypothetical protein